MPDVLDDELLFYRNKDASAGQWSYQHPADVVVVPPNAAAELLDIDIDKIGQRSKRKGYTLRADAIGTSKDLGLYGFRPAGATRYLVKEVNGVIYTWDGAAATWTSRQTGLTAPSDWTEFIAAVNRIFRLSNTDQIYSSTDGVTWAAEGNGNTNFPLVKIAIWASIQRMFAANTTSTPENLFYSNSGDPRTYDRTTNVFKIGKNDRDGVQGLIEYTSLALMAFTKEEMHFLDISNATPSNWTRNKVADIGCVAPRTVRLIGEDALFLSLDGVRSVLQSAQDKKRVASLPVSFPIQDWIDRINWPYVFNAIAWVWNDKYYLSVPVDTSQVNSHTFVWSRRAFEANGRKGGWAIYRNWGFNAFAQIDFSDKYRLYGGNAGTVGRTFELRSAIPTDDATSDNGTAITYSETGLRRDFDSPEILKSFRKVEVVAIAQTTGTITVEAQIDGGGYTTLGTITQAGGLPQLPIALPFNLGGANLVRGQFDASKLGKGRDIQIRCTEATLDAACEIVAYYVEAYPDDAHLVR